MLTWLLAWSAPATDTTMADTLCRHECGHEHASGRGNWLRAGVMGATDGLVSTAGLMMGVSGSVTDHKTLVMSGVAGEANSLR